MHPYPFKTVEIGLSAVSVTTQHGLIWQQDCRHRVDIGSANETLSDSKQITFDNIEYVRSTFPYLILECGLRQNSDWAFANLALENEDPKHTKWLL
jgi:hypothetical protein